LFRSVVLKEQELVKTRAKPGIGGNEVFHFLCVARHDDHEIMPVVFHQLEQRFDGFLTKVISASFGIEGIGFVNKEYAAQGLAHYFLDLERRLSDVAGDQIAPITFDQVAATENL